MSRQLGGHLGDHERDGQPGERDLVRVLLGSGFQISRRDDGADGHEREVKHGDIKLGWHDDKFDVPGAQAKFGPEALAREQTAARKEG